jgi:hypothetical protein
MVVRGEDMIIASSKLRLVNSISNMPPFFSKDPDAGQLYFYISGKVSCSERSWGHPLKATLPRAVRIHAQYRVFCDITSATFFTTPKVFITYAGGPAAFRGAGSSCKKTFGGKVICLSRVQPGNKSHARKLPKDVQIKESLSLCIAAANFVSL